MFAPRRVVSRSRDGEPRGSLYEPCRVPGVKWSRDCFPPCFVSHRIRPPVPHLGVVAAEFSAAARTCVCAWRPCVCVWKQKSGQPGEKGSRAGVELVRSLPGIESCFLGFYGPRPVLSVLCSKARFSPGRRRPVFGE